MNHSGVAIRPELKAAMSELKAAMSELKAAMSELKAAMSERKAAIPSEEDAVKARDAPAGGTVARSTRRVHGGSRIRRRSDTSGHACFGAAGSVRLTCPTRCPP